MKKKILTFAMMLIASIAMAQAPAFPGAEGVARLTTTGGRGGKVIHVTNLNDSGTGSLRAAIATAGARIVVFDVSGTIELQSSLKISNDNISIEGQTAPGDGICLKNYTMAINANNVIVRFIRCRMGDEAATEDDAMTGSHHDNSICSNIIIDHCSISWSTDECGSFYGNKNFSLQWCMLSESLRVSIHEKGTHGYGAIWGGQNALFAHNLLAHHDSRNPRFDHDYVSTLKGPIDYINNVVYNWGSNSSYGGESANDNNTYRKINMVNNYYKYGPATGSHKYRIANPTTSCSNCTSAMSTSTIVPGHFYVAGNYVYGSSSVTGTNWNGIEPDDASYTSAIKSDTRFTTDAENDINMHAATTAYEKVLNYVGDCYRRDTIDRRIVREAKTGTYTFKGSNGSTGGLIDTQGDVGGWPILVSKTKLTDTDNDGMPDVWETANGLNPNDASDAITYTLDTKGYYTNIEVYCNSLVEPLVKLQMADAESGFTEYYPTTTSATGIEYYDGKVAEGDYTGTKTEDDSTQAAVTYVLSQETYSSSPTAGEYDFNNGFSITNTAPKAYGKGNDNCIKYSSNTQYTINIPSAVTIKAVNFYGYDNYADVDSYIGELNSTVYPQSDTNVFKAKNADGTVNMNSIDFTLSTPVISTLSFTPKGKQIGAIITLTGTTSTTSGINLKTTNTTQIANETYYNIQGIRLRSAQKGLNIRVIKFADGTMMSTKIIK
jgi:hypothetical protein